MKQFVVFHHLTTPLTLSSLESQQSGPARWKFDLPAEQRHIIIQEIIQELIGPYFGIRRADGLDIYTTLQAKNADEAKKKADDTIATVYGLMCFQGRTYLEKASTAMRSRTTDQASRALNHFWETTAIVSVKRVRAARQPAGSPTATPSATPEAPAPTTRSVEDRETLGSGGTVFREQVNEGSNQAQSRPGAIRWTRPDCGSRARVYDSARVGATAFSTSRLRWFRWLRRRLW